VMGLSFVTKFLANNFQSPVVGVDEVVLEQVLPRVLMFPLTAFVPRMLQYVTFYHDLVQWAHFRLR
jgi:hypothetical protein